MKVYVVLVLAGFACLTQAQVRTPLASPESTVSCMIGLTEIKIDYFRPKAKGRDIFGSGNDYLVPYGKIWRTGANNGTTLYFSDDVKVQGSPVSKGQYLVFTWPDPSEWAVSLYKDVSLGGNVSDYDRDNEVIRFKIAPERLTEKVETFTVNISDIDPNNEHAKIQLSWEHTSVKFSIDVDYDDRVMASIQETDMNQHPESLVTAARYYFERKRNLEQALKWISKYLEIDEKKGTEFWNLYLKASIQKALYDKKGALITAKKSLELAKMAENDFGYIKQNEDLIATLK